MPRLAEPFACDLSWMEQLEAEAGMPRFRHGAGRRVDNTSKPLIAHARSLGFDYEAVNGTFDGVLALHGAAICVDWKSPGALLTPAQQRMVARGFPVRFISRPEQLDQLKQEMQP